MSENTKMAIKSIVAALTMLENEFIKDVNSSMSFTPYQMAAHLTQKDSGTDLKKLAELMLKLNAVYQELKNL